MIQATASDIMRVLSVERWQISTGLLQWLQNTSCDYIDGGTDHEDMYSVTIDKTITDTYALSELEEIIELCETFGCSYFRIINQ